MQVVSVLFISFFIFIFHFQYKYIGIFHFRVWRFGEWIDIVVDDLLPFNIDKNSLVGCHNKRDSNEMFGPLLEKAFAKLNGCYEFLEGGDPIDAMIDMTGGFKRCICFFL